MAWTTDILIAKVRRKARIPDGSSALSDAELLQIGDEVTRTEILSLLRATGGEWGVTQYTTPLVSGQKSYRIPERVQAGTVRKVTLVKSNGSEIDMPELGIDYGTDVSGSWFGCPTGFVFEGNSIVFPATPTNPSESLRIRYRRLPSDLVLTTDASVQAITAVSSTVITVAALQSGLNGATEADVVQARPPFDLLGGPDSAGTGDTGANTWTPTTAQVAVDAQVGDYLCLPGFTPVPQVPPVLHDLLVYGMAAAAAEELGSSDVDRLRSRFREVRKEIHIQLSDRNEGGSPAVFDRNSPLRTQRRWGGIW